MDDHYDALCLTGPERDDAFCFEQLGKIVAITGTAIQATGLDVKIGDRCQLEDDNGCVRLYAEVIGFTGETTLLVPLGPLTGLSHRLLVRCAMTGSQLAFGDGYLGRVIDGLGAPLDGKGPIASTTTIPLHRMAPPPHERPPIRRQAITGIRAVDAFLSVGEGQRIGIFAPAGGGKSSLLGMLARGTHADINVIVLVGERGREVNEFIQDNLPHQALQRSVIVTATADRSAMERVQAVLTGTAIAEYFRDQGYHVLFLMDSVTRYARALREIGMASGEMVSGKQYPPSVYAALPRVFERAGSNLAGRITSFFTVLTEGEQAGADPIAEEVRSLLDGHILLSSRLAARTHYPAIDILRSASRVMHRIVPPSHTNDANLARKYLARYEEAELLIQMGEYQQGTDPETDRAIRLKPRLDEFLCQSPETISPLDETQARLRSILEACE